MMPRWLMLLIIALTGFIAVAGWSRREQLPEPMVSSSMTPYDVSRCAECHDEICQSFAQAPHFHTLHSAQAAGIKELFADREVTLWNDRFRFTAESEDLRFSAERFPTDTAVDWVFGSGHHARTPIALREGLHGETELVQLHVSWYADNALGVTPGSESQGDRLPSLGIHHSAAETLRCFTCHTSYLPVEEGRIQFSRIKAGINCTRCHTRTDRHQESEGEIPTGTNWTALSPLEAINRCGECHRRADEFTPDELKPTARQLSRFAPVGLVQSACFQATHGTSGERTTNTDSSSTRLDCVTCHDPHQPAQADPWFYVATCLKCHSSAPHGAPDCAAQPMNSQCLTCHMPKIPTNEHLSFTDHWIRIPNGMERKENQGQQ